ncbi:MAG: citrate transporter, partial [Asticcacaulis sp.]|nr:citrate transporter [Asticcacaulis sp.]
MLAIIGLVAIAALLLMVMTQRVSSLVALVIVAVGVALACGYGLGTGKLILAGIEKIAPVAGMFIFAILFFGVMSDAGMLDPIIRRIIGVVGNKPSRITVGTAALALLIHLDGSGAVCFLITIPAMLPLYDALRMDRRVLACCASLAAGVNFLPWTGPTLRASAALGLPVGEIFTPMIGVQAVGLAFVFAAAWWLGKREERRLGLH